MTKKMTFHYTGNKKYKYLQSIGIKKGGKMRKKVAFRTMKLVKVPVRVSFRTGEGRRISFKATRAVMKPKKRI